MEIISHKGRTALVYRMRGGVVLKSPRVGVSERLLAEIKNAFIVERQILERLGNHPGIVRYRGPADNGLLFDEADGGDLQARVDSDSSEIDNSLRKDWSLQVVNAVAYVHGKGIFHNNLSLNNVLIHGNSLKLADFGGSKCLDLGLDGQLIPDPPFLDPRLTAFNTPKVDVFSLGVLLYIINTGQYPFHQGPVPQDERRFKYEDYVHDRLERGEFPDLSGVPFADIIAGCCCERRYETAGEVLAALEAET